MRISLYLVIYLELFNYKNWNTDSALTLKTPTFIIIINHVKSKIWTIQNISIGSWREKKNPGVGALVLHNQLTYMTNLLQAKLSNNVIDCFVWASLERGQKMGTNDRSTAPFFSFKMYGVILLFLCNNMEPYVEWLIWMHKTTSRWA